MTCPYCGAAAVEYLGVTDGGGDYGDSICDEFRCHECDTTWEEHCVEWAIDGEGDE